MKYTVGGKEVSLTDKNFLGAGGEGNVYEKSGTIYKILHNTPSFDLVSKMKELSVLNSQTQILNPLLPIYNGNTLAGYTMAFASNTESFAKVITNSYQQRNNITENIIQELFVNFMELVSYVHSKQILIVDMNEFNFLVGKNDYKKILAIDVDSWQTPSFPATAIMPSIQDFHSTKFSELTDWYSFGILAFQLFTGIHPFKGKFSNDPKMKLAERMQKNISVFNPRVSTPSATRDIDSIPINVRSWMESIFEKGKRTPPPDVLGKAISKASIKRIHGSQHFVLTDILEAIVRRVEVLQGIPVYYTSEGISYNNRTYKGYDKYTELIVLPNGDPVFASIKNGKVSIFHKEEIISGVPATSIQVIDNNLYGFNTSPEGNQFFKVKIDKIGDRLFVTAPNRYELLRSSSLHKGTVYQNLLGIPTFYIPFKNSLMSIINIKDLKGHTIIDAKYEKQVLHIITSEKGIYTDRFFSLSEDLLITEEQTIPNISVHEANFTVMDNGIFVSLNGDDEVTIGNRRASGMKVLPNANLFGANLFSFGNKICINTGTKIKQLSMK